MLRGQTITGYPYTMYNQDITEAQMSSRMIRLANIVMYGLAFIWAVAWVLGTADVPGWATIPIMISCLVMIILWAALMHDALTKYK